MVVILTVFSSLTTILHFCSYSKNLDKSIIKNLKNDSASISWKSQGCFHHFSDSLTIKNENSSYFMNDGKKTTKLTEMQVKKLMKFESQLNSIPQKDGGCTTVETYRITLNGKIKEIKDSRCKWDGWENLKKDLNFK